MSVQKQAGTTDDQTPQVFPGQEGKVSTTIGAKEGESANIEEEKLLKEVVERSRQVDSEALEAEKKIGEALGQEIRHFRPEMKVPADLAKHGVKSPQEEASKVIDKGGTLELPISEQEYKMGEKIKIKGHDDHKSIIGVSALAAFVLYLGRIIKLAHYHTKKVIFRKPEGRI